MSKQANDSPSQIQMRSRIRLRQLVLVDALGAEGSLHKAGERLGTTQPNATRLLQELEKILGVVLFERTKAGLIPTEHGRVMVRHARVLLADLEHARRELDAVSEGLAGTVRIGTLNSNDPSFLASAVADLESATEGKPLQFRITEGAYDTLIEQLLNGDLDVLLARGRDDPRSDDVTTEVLFQDDFTVVCGAGDPLGSGPIMDPAALLERTWVLPDYTSLLRRNIDLRLLALCGAKPPRVIESVSILTTLELVRQGRHLGILPQRTAESFAALGVLRIVPFDLRAATGPTVLLRRSTNDPAPTVQLFIDILRRQAKRYAGTVKPGK